MNYIENWSVGKMSIHDRTLIIDVTYQCNSRCIYCQWSLSNNIERIEPNIEHLMISSELLRSLKVKRVVFSGGEPILSKHIGELIRYYTDYWPVFNPIEQSTFL